MKKQKNLIILLLFSFLLLTPCRTVRAKTPVRFDADHVEFRYLNDEDENWFKILEDSEDIVSAKSTNEKVATVSFHSDELVIHPKGVGKCDAVATDANGKTATIHVTVEKSFMAEKLKNHISLSNTWYGTKAIKVEALLGATGKLKIGSKTYKFSIPKKDSYYVTGVKKIKIKKVFKLNTKVTCTVSVISNGTTVTAKVTDKLGAQTGVIRAKAKKKALTLTVFNLHKGDTVKVKYKGKTYTRKIKKDKDGKDSKIKFTLKKKLTKNASFIVTINNKDKKKLSKEKITLTGWKYEYMDDDDVYEGYYDE